MTLFLKTSSSDKTLRSKKKRSKSTCQKKEKNPTYITEFNISYNINLMPEPYKKFDYFFINFSFNIVLVIVLTTVLLLKFFKLNVPISAFEIASVVALIPVIFAAFESLKKKEVSVDFLAAVALIFAFLAHEWYSAAFINLMLSSARIFDLWTQRRGENLIKSLLKYRPEKVKVIKGKNIETRNVDEVKLGDLIMMGSGERFAVDGIVVSGQSSVDEATLTGESEPKTKNVGDHVFSPTLNISGTIVIKTEKIAKESTLSKIITLVEQATLKKSKTVRTINAFASWYIVATFVAAVIIYLYTRNLTFVLAILLVVCADDIAVSIPLAFTAAISRAAKRGMIIKSGDVLERLPKIDVIITDKTGTLTFAKPKIKEITVLNDKKSIFLEFLAAAEGNSSHPIAKTILEFLKKEKIEIPSVNHFKEFPGEGTRSHYKTHEIIAGKLDLLEKDGVTISHRDRRIFDTLTNSGFSITALAKDKKLQGFVTFEDEVRPSAKNVIAKTKKLGVKLWIMLTGDNAIVAKKVADETGIDKFETNLSAKDKLTFIEEYKNKNKKEEIAMVGDGVNDAAALSMTDISFAMGVAGSDAAISAADVALMDDDLEKIPESILLGRKTRKIVYQNFAIWGITNAVGLGLVAFGIIGPTGAATYNFLTDFIPIFNALRVGTK